MIRRTRGVGIALLALVVLVTGGIMLGQQRQAAAMREQGIVAVRIGVGEQYTIKLKSNPSTGYSWQATFDAALVELVSQSYQHGGSDLPGAGGEEILVLRGLAKGTAEIALKYARPWEGEPAETVTYRLTIR